MKYTLLLLVGFVLLIGGAQLLVNMSILFARRLRVPTMIIGMTMVAFGTSLPEFIVGLNASISGENAMVFGNVIGSNILNVFVMLGLCALIYPCVVSRQNMRIDIPIAILAAVMMLVLPFFSSLFAQDEKNLLQDVLYFSRFHGLLFMTVFLCFMVYTARIFKRNEEHILHDDEHTAQKTKHRLSTLKNTLYLLIGLVTLIFGGRLITSSAVSLAAFLKVSTRIISIVVVAFGTSLPELAVSVVSACKKHSELALGNIVGSNIFNVFFILGTCVIISPIAIEKNARIDLIVHLISISLLAAFVALSKTRTLSRITGAVFVTLYILYILYIVQLL